VVLRELEELSAANAWAYFEQLCEDPQKVQASILSDILTRNANCEIGKTHHFDEINTVASYQKKLPLSTWSDYIDFSKQMQEGAADKMFTGKAIAFLSTSGTSGLKKQIPETELNIKAKTITEKLRRYILFSRFPEVLHSKILPLVNPAESSHTSAGIPIGSASGLSMKHSDKHILDLVAFPNTVFKLQTQEEQDYVIMRYAIEQDIRFIAGNNLVRMAKLIKVAQDNAAYIIDDIANGTVASHIVMDNDLRQELELKLKPNKARAQELLELVNNINDFIPANYWKKLRLISCWLSGSVGAWVDGVKPLFGDGVSYYDYGFGASEGKFNIPHRESEASGILAIHSGFYEFIPYGENTDKVLLAHELEVGKEYEMIITNYAGLYRYQMFDIIRVEGFFMNTPEIVFVSKSGDVGDLVGERLAGSIISRVVNDIFVKEGIAIEFACAITIQNPPHYQICVELKEQNIDVDLDKVAIKIDQEFRKETGYNLMRRDDLLFAPKLRLMRQGWTEALYQNKAKGTSRSQVKLPIVYKEKLPIV
jgi:hypothetical protein